MVNHSNTSWYPEIYKLHIHLRLWWIIGYHYIIGYQFDIKVVEGTWVILWSKTTFFSAAKFERWTGCPKKTVQPQTCLLIDRKTFGSLMSLDHGKHTWKDSCRSLLMLLFLKHHEDFRNTSCSKCSSHFQVSVDKFPILMQSSCHSMVYSSFSTWDPKL